MSKPEFSMYIFEVHQPQKFSTYTEIPHIKGFSLPNEQDKLIYLLDNEDGWSDYNGCYYDQNGTPAGWIILSNDGKDFLKFDMTKKVTSSGKNIFYSSTLHKITNMKKSSQKEQEQQEEKNQQKQDADQNNKNKKTQQNQGKQKNQEKQQNQKNEGKQEKNQNKKNKQQVIQFYDADKQTEIIQYNYDYNKQELFAEKDVNFQDDQKQKQNVISNEEKLEKPQNVEDQNFWNQNSQNKAEKTQNAGKKQRQNKNNRKNRNKKENQNEEENYNEEENQKHFNLDIKENTLSAEDFLKYLADIYDIKPKSIVQFENQILQLVEEKDAIKAYLKNKQEKRDQKQKFIISI